MPIYKTNKIKNGKQGYRVVYNYKDIVSGQYLKKEKTIYGKTEAQAQLDVLRNDAKIETLISAGELTDENFFPSVSEVCDQFNEARSHEVRESTLIKAVKIQQFHILPYIGDKEILKLSKVQMQEWKNTIADKELSLSRKQAIYIECNAIFKYAMRLDYINTNPLQPLGNFKRKIEENTAAKLRYYTKEEFEKFITVAKSHIRTNNQWNVYVAFCFLYLTGCRKGEMNGAKWIDLEDNVLHIKRSVNQKIKGKRIVETPPKTQSSIRDITLPKQLIDLLNEHRKRQQAQPGYTDNWYIVGGDDVVSDTSLEKYCIKYADECGLHHISIHEFRHSHASLLINQGCNIKAVSQRLGHATIEMTMQVYSHLYPSQNEMIAKALSEIEL